MSCFDSIAAMQHNHCRRLYGSLILQSSRSSAMGRRPKQGTTIMTRHIDSKIAIRTTATAPASILSDITVSSPASQASLANILLRPFRRAQIARELQSLDERMLRDIGVTKSDIDRVAAESAGGEEWVVVALAKYLGRKLAAWASRRDAYRRLMALDIGQHAVIESHQPAIS